MGWMGQGLPEQHMFPFYFILFFLLQIYEYIICICHVGHHVWAAQGEAPGRCAIKDGLSYT